MQQLVRIALEGLVDFGSRCRIQVGQLVEQPPQFLLAQRLPVFAQPLDDRAGRPMVHLLHEQPGFFFDDRQRRRQFGVALLAVVGRGGLQIVDRIKIHAQPIADRRLEIARHRQIENQQRPLIALRLEPLEPLERHDRLCRAGGADDQIGGDQMLVEFFPRSRPAAEFGGQFARLARRCG